MQTHQEKRRRRKKTDRFGQVSAIQSGKAVRFGGIWLRFWARAEAVCMGSLCKDFMRGRWRAGRMKWIKAGNGQFGERG